MMITITIIIIILTILIKGTCIALLLWDNQNQNCRNWSKQTKPELNAGYYDDPDHGDEEDHDDDDDDVVVDDDHEEANYEN